MTKVKANPKKRAADKTEKVASDNTGPKVDTRFKSGADWLGNAKGRPKGSRNKLNASSSMTCTRCGWSRVRTSPAHREGSPTGRREGPGCPHAEGVEDREGSGAVQ